MSQEQRRWKKLSSLTQRLLLASPDEHSCLEFKENAQPLTADYMATMANAAALAGEEKATILVGVTEDRDPQTGITIPRVFGLPDSLHKAAEMIAQRAAMTQPTPIHIDIFEENVDSDPILRVEITPTMPPHYDQLGRRATRQHNVTRAMSDQEILQLLEAREKRRYAGVAEDTANLMMGGFRVVGDEVIEQLERQKLESESGTGDVLGEIDQVLSRIDDLEMALLDLPQDFDPSDPISMEHVMQAVVRARTAGIIALSFRFEELTESEVSGIERVVNSAPDPLKYLRNHRELGAWERLQAMAFDEGSDIGSAIRTVVATHDSEGQPGAISLRSIVDRSAKRRAGAARETTKKRSTAKRQPTKKPPASPAA